MDIKALEQQFKMPGVEFITLCTFECTNQATGYLTVELDDGTIDLPVCETCVMLLDKQRQGLYTE